MKFLKSIGLMIVMVIFMAAVAMAGEVSGRTETLTATAAPGGGVVTWTNTENYASTEILYVDAWNMYGAAANTLTVYRVTANYTETLGTIPGSASSNGCLVLKTSNVGKDLVRNDMIRIQSNATNTPFSAAITRKQLNP